MYAQRVFDGKDLLMWLKPTRLGKFAFYEVFLLIFQEKLD